ncbi:MAG: thioredoxin-disulfide reductase [Puniceicoccales bacterium]|jgi:thioredoxin reductase (NADPH)|nr:thioredoxin-disulfide reductase [Puniceicoccales bacterium]
MTDDINDIIILGSGCAGLTAAIYSARAGLRPLVLEGGRPGGQLVSTSDVENFPGFPDGIDGFTLVENMRRQAEKFGSRFDGASVESVLLDGEVKTLRSAAKTLRTRALIIATGASPRLLGIPGEGDFFGGNGVSTCATCDGAFFRGAEIAVVGGGDSACEEALFLTRFASRVHLIHRRSAFRASDIMAKRVAEHPKISPVLDTTPVAVLGGADGKVRALAVRNVKSGEEREIALQGVFVAIGHEPNTKVFAGKLPLDAQGYILPHPQSGLPHTGVEGVFAAGDCADPVYQQAISAAGSGCRAAIAAERWLEEHGR